MSDTVVRCAFCDTLFEPSRSDAKFCTTAHRKAAFRARRARRDEAELQALGRLARRAVRAGELEPLDALFVVVAPSPLVRDALRSRLAERVA